jgi:hypothetical protein
VTPPGFFSASGPNGLRSQSGLQTCLINPSEQSCFVCKSQSP